MGTGDRYAQQPSYNESFAPLAPPSYSEAVGALDKSLYPVSPAFPPDEMGQLSVPSTVPTQPHVITVPAAANAIPITVGPKPSFVTCPVCNARVKTNTKSVSTKSAHLACFLLCIFGCCLCSCIPYCMNAFSVVQHYCPNCNNFIGAYKH